MSADVVAACMTCDPCGTATSLYLRPKDGGEPTTETGSRWKARFIEQHPAPLHQVSETTPSAAVAQAKGR